jgi:hypothetical protein
VSLDWAVSPDWTKVTKVGVPNIVNVRVRLFVELTWRSRNSRSSGPKRDQQAVGARNGVMENPAA